jgi:hypothetical protein
MVLMSIRSVWILWRSFRRKPPAEDSPSVAEPVVADEKPDETDLVAALCRSFTAFLMGYCLLALFWAFPLWGFYPAPSCVASYCGHGCSGAGPRPRPTQNAESARFLRLAKPAARSARSAGAELQLLPFLPQLGQLAVCLTRILDGCTLRLLNGRRLIYFWL